MHDTVDNAPSIEDRLLTTAVDQFGRHGLEGASTRFIAKSAGTTMSSITYHYGGKEGLYLAAARYIADKIGEHTSIWLAQSGTQSGRLADPRAAHSAILELLDQFVQMMIRPESASWARFILREQIDPTPAFEVIYDGVMGRLLERLAGLLLTVSGGRCDLETARLHALSIVGQCLVFRFSRATVLRATEWPDIDLVRAASVRAIVLEQTHAILDAIQTPRGQA